MAVAIQVEGLGKVYQLGSVTRSLREAIGSGIQTLTGRRVAAAEEEPFWALRDVSFEVSEGQVVGIVGRNGAGKSTLLKILSRLTDPSHGSATVAGRVGSLLEVGTGFHPELTGRENIFLNGTILGMRRADIARRFDEIVAFAEIDRFLDTPVKRYSSGMYVRLAFAVAAHLEPDILLVDEVLAVGDLAFQRKCLGRMTEVAGEGRTVLFVSHNLAVVKSLCSRALLLEAGRLVSDGPVEEVVAAYVDSTWPVPESGEVPHREARIGTGTALLRTIRIENCDGAHVNRLHLDEPFRVRLVFEVLETIEDGVLEIGISTSDGVRIASFGNADREGQVMRFEPGRREVTATIDLPLLPSPQYVIDVALHHRVGLTVDWVERVAEFSVLNLGKGTTDSYPWNVVRGYVRPHVTWSGPE